MFLDRKLQKLCAHSGLQAFSWCIQGCCWGEGQDPRLSPRWEAAWRSRSWRGCLVATQSKDKGHPASSMRPWQGGFMSLPSRFLQGENRDGPCFVACSRMVSSAVCCCGVNGQEPQGSGNPAMTRILALRGFCAVCRCWRTQTQRQDVTETPEPPCSGRCRDMSGEELHAG